jgi:hypothetical protein
MVPASPVRLHAVLAQPHSIVEHVLPAHPIDLFYTTPNASPTALVPCISTERHVNDVIQIVHLVSIRLRPVHHVPIIQY